MHAIQKAQFKHNQPAFGHIKSVPMLKWASIQAPSIQFASIPLNLFKARLGKARRGNGKGKDQRALPALLTQTLNSRTQAKVVVHVGGSPLMLGLLNQMNGLLTNSQPLARVSQPLVRPAVVLRETCIVEHGGGHHRHAAQVLLDKFD